MEIGIQKVVFKDFIRYLKTRPTNRIYIPGIKDLMNTIGWWKKPDGTLHQYKRGKNSAKWFQKFLNGWLLENDFMNLNPKILTFIEDNHDCLERNGRGNDIPDFNIHCADGNWYQLDTKTYINVLDSLNSTEAIIEASKSFHKAKFVIIFCMTTKKFYWLIKTDHGYSYPVLFKDLPERCQWLFKDLALPDKVEMLRIEVPSDATDAQLPEYASYQFIVYNVIKE